MVLCCPHSQKLVRQDLICADLQGKDIDLSRSDLAEIKCNEAGTTASTIPYFANK